MSLRLLVICLAFAMVSCTQHEVADTIIVNANFYTVNSDQPTASVMAIKGDRIIGIGGETYNTAVYLSKLKPEHELIVSYVTALGIDSFSERILSNIRQHNIDDSFIERREALLPGLYTIETDENGERSFSYWRSQSAAKTLFKTPMLYAPPSAAASFTFAIASPDVEISPPARLSVETFEKPPCP